MTVEVLTCDDFESAWQSAGKYRFGYELNRPPFVVAGLLLVGFWIYLLISIASVGLDLPLSIAGMISLIVSGYLGLTALRWRHFGRLSGVICQEDRLLWRQVEEAYFVQWKDLTFDGIGLLNAEKSDNKYEQFLTIGDKKLFLFRPFVRIRHLETFIGEVLIRLEQHGGISIADSTDSTAKRRRKKKKAVR